MNVIANLCPCGQHPAERGTIYGSLNALVCSSVPGTAMYFFPDPRPRDYLFAHPQVLRDLNLTSITERCAPELSPPARAWTEVCEALRPEIEDELVLRRWQNPWGPGTWVLMRDWSVKYVPPPGPAGPIALVNVCPEPDPRLGEGAVSPTRHLRN